ncbi:hypothetical protein [Streptomyces sp. NPDC051183]|uniref:hypothetical protein n=1 Tax=Streptomyces sp. NPDC051183 TaxID=3155165 RepID=UPI003421961E
MPHLYYSLLAMPPGAPARRRLHMPELTEILKITRSRLTYAETRPTFLHWRA